MTDSWYFAYGSNLSVEQMQQRIGKTAASKRAELIGYRLAFNKRGGDGTGKANIVEEPKATVWGVAYRCGPDELRQMDRYEGVRDGHYFRKELRVRCDDGEMLVVIAYVAGAKYVEDSLGPSADYLDTIVRGARKHQLPADYLRQLEEVVTCSRDPHSLAKGARGPTP